MKQKTHSGLKKRVKIRKSGTAAVKKSCKNHLLSNKSRRQKKSYMSGMPIDKTRVLALRRLMPGKMVLKTAKRSRSKKTLT
ncbi:MAG: 50S ribosomal protein L35 [Candidatus Peregrinibacteria bacterium]